ncbi:MAG TPA: GNAT family N-acetyltransferase [Gemmatimonadales bacterium]|nr:GNAT family N-acetyltransferase [Gemmatimonadales bacterium]
MNPTVRRVEEGDVDAIFACLRTYGFHLLGGRFADPDFPADAVLSVRNAISHCDLRERCWLAERDGSVLGFCSWDWIDQGNGSAKTLLIVVLPSARSLGVGSLLQRRRMEEMRDLGAREVHTWSDDPKAIQWYQGRFGYAEVGREPLLHCLHRFQWGDRAEWGIHRGFREQDELAHLVANLTTWRTE